MKAWGRHEKVCAQYYGGIRHVRINYAERAGDILHPTLTIECKYGKCIPAKAMRGEQCKFLDDAFAQARGYDPAKIPMVCLKKPGMRGWVEVTINPTSLQLQSALRHLPTDPI